jgi:hypothetical protein
MCDCGAEVSGFHTLAYELIRERVTAFETTGIDVKIRRGAVKLISLSMNSSMGLPNPETLWNLST